MTTRPAWWTRIGARIRGTTPTPHADDAAGSLELAVTELREQHRVIVEQAAEIVAVAARDQALLERAVDEHRRLVGAAEDAQQHAADAAAGAGDHPEQAARWEAAVDGLAVRIEASEHEIEERRTTAAASSEAAARARAVVARSAAAVGARIEGYQRLRSDLDEAQLQEQLNDTLRRLDPHADPSGLERRDLERSIEARLATARALTEIRGRSPDGGRPRPDTDRSEDGHVVDPS